MNPLETPVSPSKNAHDPLGALEGVADSAIDATTRRQAAMLAIGRRAIAPPNLSMLIQDAAALIAETLDLDYSGVTRRSDDGSQLELRLARTGEEDAEPDLEERSSDATASLAGYALSVAHPVTVTDLGAEDRFTDAHLQQNQIQCAIACPLIVQNEAFGVMSAYGTQPREFSQEDLMFAETIAHLITTNIARERSEEALSEKSRFSTAVFDTMNGLVIVMDAEGRINHFNRHCAEVTGFAPGEIKGRHLWNALLISEEVALVRESLARLRAGESSVKFESYLLTKHGNRRRIAWACTTQNTPDGSAPSTIITGIDITEQREAEEQRDVARAEMAEASESLKQLLSQVDENDLPLLGLSVLRDPPAEEWAAAQPFSRMPEEIEADRRRKSRRSYPYVQRVAPLLSDELPEREEFQEVRCRDISAGGFSFLSDTKPEHKIIVVALGAAPSLTYLTAEIVHTSEVERDGRTQHVMGCHYLKRWNT